MSVNSNEPPKGGLGSDAFLSMAKQHSKFYKKHSQAMAFMAMLKVSKSIVSLTVKNLVRSKDFKALYNPELFSKHALKTLEEYHMAHDQAQKTLERLGVKIETPKMKSILSYLIIDLMRDAELDVKRHAAMLTQSMVHIFYKLMDDDNSLGEMLGEDSQMEFIPDARIDIMLTRAVHFKKVLDSVMEMEDKLKMNIRKRHNANGAPVSPEVLRKTFDLLWGPFYSNGGYEKKVELIFDKVIDPHVINFMNNTAKVFDIDLQNEYSTKDYTIMWKYFSRFVCDNVVRIINYESTLTLPKYINYIVNKEEDKAVKAISGEEDGIVIDWLDKRLGFFMSKIYPQLSGDGKVITDKILNKEISLDDKDDEKKDANPDENVENKARHMQ